MIKEAFDPARFTYKKVNFPGILHPEYQKFEIDYKGQKGVIILMPSKREGVFEAEVTIDFEHGRYLSICRVAKIFLREEEVLALGILADICEKKYLKSILTTAK